MYSAPSQEKRDKVKACLLSGMSMKKTAKYCNVGYYFVAHEQRKHNIPKTHETFKKCAPSTIKKIKKLLAEGKTLAYIAKTCRVSPFTAANYRFQSAMPRSYRGRLSNTQKQRISQLLLDGVSETEISRICKTKVETVKNIKIANSIDSLDKIKSKLLAGESFKKISTDCNIPVYMLKMAKKKFGIDDHRSISDNKIAKVMECLASGMSVRMAAKASGMSVFTARKICEKRKIPISDPSTIPSSTKQEMKRRLEHGEHPLDVAAACNVSLTSVRRFQKTAQVVLPKKRQPPSKNLDPSCSAKARFSKMTELEKQKMTRLLLSGKTNSQVAAACGRSISTVGNLRHELQLPRPPGVCEPKLDKIKRFLAEGESPSSIADQCGLTIMTINRVIKWLNIHGQPVIKEEQLESLALFAENASGSSSASSSFKHIEFLDEIPFCILI
ncbi:hypothetical protein BC940DRAFT_306833 [Gongronella butleri]|nr:hypothetical protein BC940DRAFT_306833 [Gongronella butleri]